jgi:hypothetical protein
VLPASARRLVLAYAAAAADVTPGMHARRRQALSQCDGYLTRMGVIKEAVDDTAGAAKAIAAQQLRCACG